jgi:hypothetical protein
MDENVTLFFCLVSMTFPVNWIINGINLVIQQDSNNNHLHDNCMNLLIISPFVVSAEMRGQGEFKFSVALEAIPLSFKISCSNL